MVPGPRPVSCLCVEWKDRAGVSPRARGAGKRSRERGEGGRRQEVQSTLAVGVSGRFSKAEPR